MYCWMPAIYAENRNSSYAFQTSGWRRTFTVTDFFDRKSFYDLEEALKRMAAKDNDDHKPGLKLSLGYLLKKPA